MNEIFHVTEERTMQHTITEHYNLYHPERLSYDEPNDPHAASDGFLLRVRLKQPPAGTDATTVFEIPGILRIVTGIHHFPEALDTLDWYRRGEYYEVYADADGNSPYIEAELQLHPLYGEDNVRCMTLGLPLNLYFASEQPLYLLYDGVRFAWIAGGEIVNANFPAGTVRADGSPVFCSDTAEIGISCAVHTLEYEEKAETKHASIAFYSARGYNAWGGDIVNFYHDGVYHFLVLFDRHHHSNRFGGGAHSPYHMTTRDFVHWENYGEMYPLRHSWESFGTGTLFFQNGKYYYSHGFHTDRVIPREQVGSRLLEQNYRKEGVYRAVPYEELERHGLYPSGANYMVSEDGIHFSPGRKQVHCAENPSIYEDGNGGLLLYAGYGATGLWRAPCIDGPWKKEETDIPIFSNSSPVRNTSECPSIFEWNGYRYIIMGFRGYWQSGYRDSVFTDLAATGHDLYDGLCVPMVANCDGRYILSGWVGGSGWGFVTLHRELIQHEGGRLGIRWMPELTPDPAALTTIAAIPSVGEEPLLLPDSRTSYYLECRVRPQKDGRIGLSVSGSGKGFVFELNSARRKVQTLEADTNGFTEEVRALYEYIPEMPEERTDCSQIPSPNLHTNSHDFAIAHVEELGDEYTLKIIFHYEKKSDSLVMDAEIGGGRTFISNRPYFRAERIRFLTDHAEIRDLKLCRLDG